MGWWQAVWKPWGEVQSIMGTLTQNLRYPGQFVQIETSLHHNWHRHDDPATGRCTQPDPPSLKVGRMSLNNKHVSPIVRACVAPLLQLFGVRDSAKAFIP
jgi:RHS repeat-associated protein